MKQSFVRFLLAAVSLVALNLPAAAGLLDDYYLSQFSPAAGAALQKAILAPPEQPACGTPLKRGLQRDWKYLEPATQKVLAKQLAAPVLSGTETTLTSTSGRFLLHYTTSGADAVPSAGWVQTVADTFDSVASAYAARGWRLAPTVNGAPYDIYLRSLAPLRLYGQTTSSSSVSGNSFASYIEIDNDYLDSIYANATGGPYSPLQSLQITAAHEYHHAIQYGYNLYFDIWYGEATSTWFEDELFDAVNQLYNYIPAWFNNSRLAIDITASTSNGGGYGRWIFNRYLAERFGLDIVRAMWEKLSTLNSSNGSDIPMAPVIESVLTGAPYSSSLSTEFFGFTKRVYDQKWTSHLPDISRIHPATPTATFSTFPVTAASVPAPAVTLPHYSFAYYTFAPSAGIPDLTITVRKNTGIQTAVFRNAGGTVTEVGPNPDGTSYTVTGFGSLAPSDEVALLIANTTSTDSVSATFSTDGNPATPPSTPTPAPAPAAASGGGGGGCFIATAAYGSYLHPQVQILRQFRDNHLLTNAPGRALVSLYYRLSPPAADVIAQHPLLRLLARLVLTPVILAVSHPGTAALLAGSLLSGWAIRRRCRHGSI